MLEILLVALKKNWDIFCRCQNFFKPVTKHVRCYGVYVRSGAFDEGLVSKVHQFDRHRLHHRHLCGGHPYDVRFARWLLSLQTVGDGCPLGQIQLCQEKCQVGLFHGLHWHQHFILHRVLHFDCGLSDLGDASIHLLTDLASDLGESVDVLWPILRRCTLCSWTHCFAMHEICRILLKNVPCKLRIVITFLLPKILNFILMKTTKTCIFGPTFIKSRAGLILKSSSLCSMWDFSKCFQELRSFTSGAPSWRCQEAGRQYGAIRQLFELFSEISGVVTAITRFVMGLLASPVFFPYFCCLDESNLKKNILFCSGDHEDYWESW